LRPNGYELIGDSPPPGRNPIELSARNSALWGSPTGNLHFPLDFTYHRCPRNWRGIAPLKPIGITQCKLAKGIGVPQMRISEIVAGKRSITADTALRLARFFGTDAQSWMNLQTQYDLTLTEEKISDVLNKDVFSMLHENHRFTQCIFWLELSKVSPELRTRLS
jgi:addiction module HigA family antidote